MKELEGKEGGRRTCRSRSIIYSRVCCAKFSAADVYTAYVVITSSHLRRSRTRIFAIDKSARRVQRDASRDPREIPPDRYQLQSWAGTIFFSAAGADRSYPPLVAAIRRGSLRALQLRRDTRESRKWKRKGR